MCSKCVRHALNLVCGWLEDAIVVFEDVLIDLGDKILLEIFVKYEKIGWRLFLVPKSTKKGIFLV